MADRLIAGAMSGTSADGVDVALVKIDGRGLAMRAEMVCHVHRLYPSSVRDAVLKIRSQGSSDLRLLAQLGREITLEYAQAVKQTIEAARVDAGQLQAIAAHGQTLFHHPPLTVQWLDPSLLAWETRCAVVSDFRRADCAAGGQGAPLVPFADYLLFRHPSIDRLLLNIGGIANLTCLRAGTDTSAVRAFDTGPGNCISDWLCRKFGPAGLAWDVEGHGASRGSKLDDVASHFLQTSYFSAPPPKSTDGPAMVLAFERAIGTRSADLNALLATAAYATGATIADAIQQHCLVSSAGVELFVSGGGLNNKAIMGWIISLIGDNVKIRRMEEMGIPPDAKEAIAFALLAAATLDGEPSNFPSVTGASQPVILGCITPRPTPR